MAVGETTRAGLAVERRPPSGQLPELELRISSRRRKTATAWWEADRLVVALPARLKGSEREEMITWLVERSSRHRPAARLGDPELLERARGLVERYRLGRQPSSVRFVTNQQRRWGSCSPERGEIRITDRLRAAPGWVLDAVLVHELAHLSVPDHSASFHELADRHPRQRDASIWLAGFDAGLPR